MASPAKAFTDPVGVSRTVSFGTSVPQPILPIKPPTYRQLALQVWNSHPWNTFTILATLKPSLPLTVVNGKIPPPPMGRMLFSTFPPIYRERTNTFISPVREFPPIYLMKLWGST